MAEEYQNFRQPNEPKFFHFCWLPKFNSSSKKSPTENNEPANIDVTASIVYECYRKNNEASDEMHLDNILCTLQVQVQKR